LSQKKEECETLSEVNANLVAVFNSERANLIRDRESARQAADELAATATLTHSADDTAERDRFEREKEQFEAEKSSLFEAATIDMAQRLAANQEIEDVRKALEEALSRIEHQEQELSELARAKGQMSEFQQQQSTDDRAQLLDLPGEISSEKQSIVDEHPKLEAHMECIAAFQQRKEEYFREMESLQSEKAALNEKMAASIFWTFLPDWDQWIFHGWTCN
jgi:hypothetical protein